MKQWEKLTAWLVVFALVAGLVGGSAFVQVSAAEENSDFAYVVNEDGTATITEVKTNAADVIVVGRFAGAGPLGSGRSEVIRANGQQRRRAHLRANGRL